MLDVLKTEGGTRVAGKRAALWLCMLCMALCTHAFAAEAGVSTGRALLIGVDEFVSKPSAYPSSTNNVYAMQEMFQSSDLNMETLLIPDQPVTDAQTLACLIRDAFGGADENDVSYLYISTHGQYEPQPALLFSDGEAECAVTPAQLQAAFDGVPGTKVIILDACNSGAFIGKGLSAMPDEVCFLGDEFKVITSSGALEESWYWMSEGQGAFYFTQALTQGLSVAGGCPADTNRDGSVTLSELYAYLLLNHAASTPQVYPQSDDTVIYRYTPDTAQEQRPPVVDVTFSGSTLSRENSEISVEFIATRPVRVAYQVVYQRSGQWEFDKAQLIYDGAERFTAFGDEPGAISAGHKVRTVHLGRLPDDCHGYVLVQLVSIDKGKLTVHAGRVLCVPPAAGDLQLDAQVSPVLDPASGREMSIFIAHDFSCELSVAILDENDQVVHRVCHRQSTRPSGLQPQGSVFYWSGALKDGSAAAPGVYRVRAQAHVNGATTTVLSAAFTIQQGGL